jgi:hypothetical protein
MAKKRRRFRIQADASVCFTIEANSIGTALRNAQRITKGYADWGVRVDLVDDDDTDFDGRVYFTLDEHQKPKLLVANVEEGGAT